MHVEINKRDSKIDLNYFIFIFLNYFTVFNRFEIIQYNILVLYRDLMFASRTVNLFQRTVNPSGTRYFDNSTHQYCIVNVVPNHQNNIFFFHQAVFISTLSWPFHWWYRREISIQHCLYIVNIIFQEFKIQFLLWLAVLSSWIQ